MEALLVMGFSLVCVTIIRLSVEEDVEETLIIYSIAHCLGIIPSWIIFYDYLKILHGYNYFLSLFVSFIIGSSWSMLAMICGVGFIIGCILYSLVFLWYQLIELILRLLGIKDELDDMIKHDTESISTRSKDTNNSNDEMVVAQV